MQTSPLRRALLLLGSCLACAASGCGGEGPGLARFGSLGVYIEEGVDEGRLPPLVHAVVFLRWPEGTEPDCALASGDIEATFNGREMAPIEGVEGTTPEDNANCLPPAFRLSLPLQEARSAGSQVTVVVREGEERVQLVAPDLLGVRGVAGQEPWTVSSLQPTVLPWHPAADDLSGLSGFSTLGLLMTPVSGGVQVTIQDGASGARRLILEGEVGTSIASCEGIARCLARVPVRQVLDLDVP